MSSINVHYDSVTEIFQADVAVQNLRQDAIGTPDGSVVVGEQVYFSAGPTVTSYKVAGDTSKVTVANPDGHGYFTAANQPFFVYPVILLPNQTSSRKTWKWNVPRTVNTFSFTVLVAAPLSSETALPAVPVADFDGGDDTLSYPVSPATSDATHARYFRTVFGIVFKEGATPAQYWGLLSRYNATVIAGSPPDEYVIQVPDPGSTLSDYDALYGRLKAEPGVDLVLPRTYSIEATLSLRLPNDAAGQQRTDYLNPSSTTTWALNTIRAPLAWGCETGTYTSARVTIGAMDYLFDASHPDLATSSVTKRDPTGKLRYNSVLDTSFNWKNHGTMVAGAMTAAGDNGKSIAGMVWASNLELYPFARGNRVVQDPAHYFARTVLPKASGDHVRVLVSSMNVPWTKADELTDMERALKRYVEAGGIFVAASGNERIKQGVVGFSEDTSAYKEVGQLIVASRLLLYDPAKSHAPNRVLIVGGTQRSANGDAEYWPDSNYFSDGGTQILAPAAGVSMLATQAALQPNDIFSGAGTSVAAPMVAGVAAQLLAFDPTLPLDSVKDYILRGAQEKRRNPATGALEDARPVAGAPGTAYQLDAYGSLSLLSRERRGTPVCGYPVLPTNGGILFRRGEAVADTVWLASGASSVSVAQGGRLLAVHSDTGSVLGVTVVDQHGTVVNQLPQLFARYYLEKDTVDLTWTQDASGWLHPEVTLTRSNGNVVGPVNLFAEADHSTTRSDWETLSFSPDGKWAAISALLTHGTSCQPGNTTWEQRIVPIAGGSGRIIHQEVADCSPHVTCTDCIISPPTSTWTHDGQSALFLIPHADVQSGGGGGVPTYSRAGYGPRANIGGPGPFYDRLVAVRTGFVTATPQALTGETVVQGVSAFNPSLSSDDAWIWSYETIDPWGTNPCNTATRVFRSPATMLSAAYNLDAVGECGVDASAAGTETNRSPGTIPRLHRGRR